MNTRLLAAFLAVAETRHFADAARTMRVAQSTVSQHVSALERHLDVQLFDRLASGVALTAEGERLLKYAHRVLDAVADLRGAVAGEEPAGSVVIGAEGALLAHLVLDVVRILRQRHPGLDLQVHEITRGEAGAAIGLGALSMALVIAHDWSDSDLSTWQLGAVTPRFVVAADHPLAGLPADWRDLVAYPCFLPAGSAFADEVAWRLMSTSPSRSQVTRIAGGDVIRACVLGGLGVAVVPSFVAADDLRAGLVAPVLGPRLPELSVIAARNVHRSPGRADEIVASALQEAAGSLLRR
ncbi:LysR family transcriptional regulator [Actinokineospora sp. HUAS TT18]|uniref:LysR family transcriptional regulator n=1 Tax=Actinokineospora sp. HUAS TT18 TaxID=3447451 RepID=UPI003F51CF34